jgi:glucokinase
MLLLGVDVGGTKIASALGDAGGEVLGSGSRPTGSSGDARADLLRIAAELRELVESRGRSMDEVAGVGVSLPGPLDLEAGHVLNPPNLPGWHRAPVRDTLAEALGVPVALENDANAATLAEWQFGAGRGFQHVVFLTMSTGVGGGLVHGGRLHRGVASSAGEVGHMPIEWDGEPCACGLRGCLEAYIGGASWARRLEHVTPADSAVAALAAGTSPRPEHVVEAARGGDAFALAELERFNRYLAQAIVQLTFALAPEVFVLGTIARAAGDALCLDPVRRLVREHVWEFLGDDLVIAAGELGPRLPELAGLGVASHAFVDEA